MLSLFIHRSIVVLAVAFFAVLCQCTPIFAGVIKNADFETACATSTNEEENLPAIGDHSEDGVTVTTSSAESTHNVTAVLAIAPNISDPHPPLYVTQVEDTDLGGLYLEELLRPA